MEGYAAQVADWWVAVSNFETAAWTSPLYKNAHNLFGMKQPRVRETLSQGPTSSGFASFASDIDSVLDLVLYMKEFNYPKDFLNFYDFIVFMKSKGYYEEDFRYYYDGVKSRL